MFHMQGGSQVEGGGIGRYTIAKGRVDIEDVR